LQQEIISLRSLEYASDVIEGELRRRGRVMALICGASHSILPL
jgi:hypothetical protein